MRILVALIVKYLTHFLILGAILGWTFGINAALIALVAAWTTVLMYVLADLLVLKLFGEGPGLFSDAILAIVVVFGVARAAGVVLSLDAIAYATIGLLFAEILDHAVQRQGVMLRH